MINLSPKWYFSQRNNQIRPSSACMPTARAMFYQGNGVAYQTDPKGRYGDDDYFMELLNQPKARKLAKKKYPWAVKDGKLYLPPNEIHGMYHSFLDPLVCGRRVSDFRTDLTIGEYYDAMQRGEVIMTSGSFPGIPGHAFCVIGVDDSHLILADPWGDFRAGYRKGKTGYGVRMNQRQFLEHVKPVGEAEKWGHVLV